MIKLDIVPMNRKETLAKKPVMIGIVAGHTFYEDPDEGDEAPLIVSCSYGFGQSDWWELPTFNDLI